MSLTGIRDVDLKILSELTDEELLNYCLTSQKGRQLCQNENFWMNRFIRKFGNYKKNPNRTWKDFYLSAVYYSNKYPHLDSAMVYAALEGHRDLVDYFISKGARNWNLGMAYATKRGRRDLVNFFISKGANDWRWGILKAVEGGHLDLIEFFQRKMEE